MVAPLGVLVKAAGTLAVLALLAACKSEPAPAQRAPAPSPTRQAPPPPPSLTPPAPATAASRPPLCTDDIDVECPTGFHSGCEGGLTTVQACIRDGVTGRAPCSAQIVVTCPAGERDSCELQPPYGAVHVCVRP